MPLKWRGSPPATYLAKVEAVRSLASDGKPSYSTLRVDEMAFVLAGALDFASDIPAYVRERLVTQALFAPVGKGSKLKDTFLPALDAELARYWRQAIHPFLVSAGISLRLPGTAATFQVREEIRLSFPTRFARRLAHARSAVLKEQTSFAQEVLPSGYRPVVVRVSARTAHEAVDRAIDAIDYLRGIWNYFFNRQQAWRLSTGRTEPVNRIRLHPIHSVHELDGKAATESWWYQPEYRAAASVLDVSREWSRMSTFTRRVRQYLTHNAYRPAIEGGLRQYVRALDRSDMSDGFMRLWAVLEVLTATAGLKYEETIRRASFVFADADLMQLILNNLRRERNRLVHEGQDSHAGEMCMYQLKQYVEALLEFHIRNRFRFQTLDEAGAFLGLPRNLQALEQKMKHFRAAKQYQKL